MIRLTNQPSASCPQSRVPFSLSFSGVACGILARQSTGLSLSLIIHASPNAAGYHRERNSRGKDGERDEQQRHAWSHREGKQGGGDNCSCQRQCSQQNADENSQRKHPVRPRRLAMVADNKKSQTGMAQRDCRNTQPRHTFRPRGQKEPRDRRISARAGRWSARHRQIVILAGSRSSSPRWSRAA